MQNEESLTISPRKSCANVTLVNCRTAHIPVYVTDIPQIFKSLIICKHVCSYKTLLSQCNNPTFQENIFIKQKYAQH